MNATITLPKTDLKTLNRMAKGMGWTVEHSKTQQPTINGGWTMDNPHLPYNPQTDNPSTDNDKWWDIAENRNEVARAAAAAYAPDAQFITLEQLKAQLNIQ